MDRLICAPMGAFMNHVRALLLFDTSVAVPDMPDMPVIMQPVDRLRFIMTYLYHDSRTWQNWLAVEWSMRDSLDTSIQVSHSVPTNPLKRTIALTVDPSFALRTYKKFNATLNNSTDTEFISSVHAFNNGITTLQNEPWLLVIDASRLWDSTLPESLYNEIVAHFGLESHYGLAAIAHAKWYSLHKKAEREVAQYINLTE